MTIEITFETAKAAATYIIKYLATQKIPHLANAIGRGAACLWPSP